MIEIPSGTRVIGTQLPIQTQTSLFVEDWERAAGPAELARLAQTADRAGFFYVAVCDHIAIPDELVPAMSSYWQDCITTLAWLAPQTHQVKLLSHVYVLPYRHPLVAAKQFSTLDHLSGGRAIVGVGAGHVQGEFEALGVDHSARGRITEERLPPLIEAFEQEAHHGLQSRPRPVQSPRPPVWVAGSSAGAIRRAATYADGWLPQGPSDPAMIEHLQSVRTRQGREGLPFAIGHITPPMYIGTPGFDVAEGVLTGNAASIAARILEGTAPGVNQVQVRFRARSCEEYCAQMEAFATDVAPALTKI